MLAGGLLMTKSFEKAEKEYKTCMDLGDVSAEIGLGHVYLAANEQQKSFNQYRKAYIDYITTATSETEGKNKFKKDFWDYAIYLNRIGVNPDDINSILESILMDVTV